MKIPPVFDDVNVVVVGIVVAPENVPYKYKISTYNNVLYNVQ